MGNINTVEDFLIHLDATQAEYLGELLSDIERYDTNYEKRYPLVIMALAVASDLGYAVGFRLDPDEPEWPVAYIELPTGQISWHLPQHPVAWDGHDTPEKYRRCRAYTARIAVAITAAR